MNCPEVMELMQRQLDDDLAEGEMEVLTNHTRQCPDCAAMFERLKLLSAELTSLPKVTPSYSLVDAILPQLEQLDTHGQQEAAAAPAAGAPEKTELPARRTKRERRWPSMRVMSGVIAAGIVAGLFLVTYQQGGGSAGNSDGSTAANMSSAEVSVTDQSANRTYSLKSYTRDEAAAAPEVSTEAADQLELQHDLDAMKQPFEGDKEEEAITNSGIAGKADDSAGAADRGQSTENLGGGGVSSEPPAQEPEAGAFGGPIDGGGADSTEGTGEADNNKTITGEPSFVPEKGFTANEISATSPDGSYIAKVEGYTIRIYAASDQSVVHESARKNGRLMNLVWSEDSAQLSYEVHLEQGSIEKYIIDMATGEDLKDVQ